jgi:hypothetical protein
MDEEEKEVVMFPHHQGQNSPKEGRNSWLYFFWACS